MEWMFGGLTVGCLFLLVKIMLDYSSGASEWHTQVRQARAAKEQAEAQVDVFVKGKEESLARISVLEEEMKALENMKNELRNKIEEVRKQHDKKGKVILHRQGQQGQ
ncbi:MAG: hypothetical protein A3F84_21315 [Candidatus Handelsmanbacteria bacterium RIFCSPLOWO2_12_FULL_64_10]|uniref:Uncharacterized protein n=1 Tax=Handelsmanbacteria sp. (strain RIFCSPLOWO2_12_FULL_64_10) TaxID=1817868 RepID=A0A1F6D3C3_HANXR|nr:MAG: hypothetical protein A3F84_21315 [Candidatus Handelsmanbacteria bacterium RIFCSPLOWO2_12_FULL_64_10]